MPRINLLPWRDEERKERKLKFLVALGGAAVGACLSAFVGYLMMDSMVSAQESRNDKLKSQIVELDKQIEGYVNLFDTLQKRSGRKDFGLPVQILGDQVMNGSVEKEEDLFKAWEEHLGVKPK